MNINNKVAVITGASAGIGAAIARTLSEAGVKLVLCARPQDADDLAAVQQQLNTESIAVNVDLADQESGQTILEAGLKAFGQLDFLINNAGLMANGPIEYVDLQAMDAMITINFSAVVRMSYTFLRHFKAQNSGAIVNITSLGARLTSPMMGVYCASKAAVEVFSTSLRRELAGTAIKVGYVAPGSTQTAMYDGLKAQAGDDSLDIEVLKPSDIADAVLHMLSQPASVNLASMSVYPVTEAF